jgi:predicted lysophospholipase L1 biosynthesis ABC-type transport system permease subunit
MYLCGEVACSLLTVAGLGWRLMPVLRCRREVSNGGWGAVREMGAGWLGVALPLLFGLFRFLWRALGGYISACFGVHACMLGSQGTDAVNSRGSKTVSVRLCVTPIHHLPRA